MKIHLLRLSFNGKPIVKRCGEHTVATVKSYFKSESLMALFGTSYIPEFISEFLTRNGYSFDPVLNGFAKKFTASIFLSGKDVDDPVKATNISRTKVKHKAYKNARRVLNDLNSMMSNIYGSTYLSYMGISNLESDEKKALERCRKTGYCDPNKIEA